MTITTQRSSQPQLARVVELVVTLVLGTSAERREGSSPSLCTMLGNSQMNLGRYRASLREIDKKPVHSQVGYKVGSIPMEGLGRG